MKFLAHVLLTAVLMIAGASVAFNQSPLKAEPQTQERLIVDTSEVVLDAVVRDKKGRPVTNLAAKDFVVYEDGVRQQISSIRLVTRGAIKADAQHSLPQPVNTAKGAIAATAGPLPAVENRPGAVALVFDRLSTEARVRAHAAALAYLEQGLGPNDFVGVFRIDKSLSTVQTFTNDAALIKQAIDRLSGEGGSVYVSGEKEIAKLWEENDKLQQQLNGANPSSSGGIMVDLMFNAMRIRTAQDFERIERDQQGYADTNSLLALINGMATLPGRKALVFFSEGVAIPPSAAARFRSVISNANRANVSVYSVDAGGLRAESSDAEAATAIARIGNTRLTQATAPTDPHGLGNMTGPMNRDLERNEDLIRHNPESGLGQLADQTGGLLISSTNDPGPRLRQVNEDLHSYYLLTYAPQNHNYDGAFRKVSITVTRPGMEVQTRKGYYGLGVSFDSPVLEYEVPALAVLSGKAVIDAFQTRCAAFSFPEPERQGLVPVVVEVPAGAINFLIDAGKTKYHADFSIVALIRDEAGHVARKVSTHYLLSGPYDKLDAALNGKILFYTETQLDPGRYSVSSIVYDALAKQASVSTANLIIPPRENDKVQLSSIVLVKDAEHLSSANSQASRMFRYNDVLLYPNLGEPISKADDRELTFFLTAYVPPADASASKLSLEISHNGSVVVQLPYDLPAADQVGRIQYAGAIPLEKFPPGDYELKVTVQNAKSKAANSTLFKIDP